MVLLENLRRVVQIELVVGARVPRQLGDPLEIRADHLRFHRLASRPLQAAELALDFGARLLGKLELAELVAKLGHLLRLVVVAELLLNRLHLLAQIHLALALAQLFLHLRLDVFLRLEQSDLALDVNEHAAQPVLDVQRLEQSLLFRNGQLDVAGDEIGELARLGDGVENLVNDFLGKTAPLAELGRALARLLLERGERRIVLIDRAHLLGRDDHRAHVAVGCRCIEARSRAARPGAEAARRRVRAGSVRSGR